MKFSGKVGNGSANKGLNFDGDSSHRLDTETVFRIRHYRETRKVVINRHKSASHTDSPDGGTGKTCLGGGLYCPNVSSCCSWFPRFSSSSCSRRGPLRMGGTEVRSVAQAACTPPVPAPAWHGARGRRMH